MTRIALAMLLLIVPGRARAQECTSGRVAVAGGYCCWPGQQWSDELQRCFGVPECPADLGGAAEECLAPGSAPSHSVDYARVEAPAGATRAVGPPRRVAAIGPPRLAAVVGPVGAGWPAVGQPAGSLNPTTESQPQEALLLSGLGIFVAAYAVHAVIAGLAFSNRGALVGPTGPDSTCHDMVGSLILIPVVGGIAAIASAENCEMATYTVPRSGTVAVRRQMTVDLSDEAGWVIASALATVVDLTALVFLVVGAIPTDVVVFETDEATATLQILPGGLSARLTF